MKKNRNQKKEKFIMLASSLFVLSALTLTGVYVKERSDIHQDAPLDLTQLNEQEEPKPIIVKKEEPVKQANTGNAVNPIAKKEVKEEKKPVEQKTEEKTRPLSFSIEEGINLPLAGEILVPYSMDKTVYFSTLDQYRYNPAMILKASEGDLITASTDGVISAVYKDPQLGDCLIMDLGNGYSLTYGQLKDIEVKEGDYVEAGGILAAVASPTKYYSTEGCNLYFSLKKDGMPLDPLSKELPTEKTSE